MTTLTYITGQNCPTCHAMFNLVKRTCETMHVLFVPKDVSEVDVNALNIQSVPTMVVSVNDNPMDSISGRISGDKLTEWLEEWI